MMENEWKNFEGKQVKVIFDDMGGFPKKKVGLLIDITPTHLIVEIGGSGEALLLTKILRVEEVKDGHE